MEEELIAQVLDAGPEEPLLFLPPPSLPKASPLKVSPETLQLLQQFTTTPPPQVSPAPSQPTDILGAVVMILVTLLGGGGAGWQAWFRMRKRWHAEQIATLKELREENKEQDCKLEQLALQLADLEKLDSKLDTLEEKLDALDAKIPAPKPATRKRTTKKTEG